MTLIPSQNLNPQLDPTLAAIHNRLQNDFPFYASKALKIKPKVGPLEPFILNVAQAYFHDKLEAQYKRIGKVRALVVKGRQQGLSTYIAGRFYHKATHLHGQSVFILSHESQTTSKLFDIVDRYHDNVPDVGRPHCEIDNKRQMKFATLGSEYSVGTAGNENVGRGGTLQLFHGSEVAFWENTDQIQTGIMQSVPDLPGTEIILESTANGMANMFYEMVVEAEQGKNDYIVVFIPWYWQTEYQRPAPSDGNYELTAEEEEYASLYSQSPYKKIPLSREQMYWRRNKISELKSEWKFKQEYPAYLQEAFQTSGDSLISAQSIIRARKSGTRDTHSPLIMGVDPGRTRDRTVFVYRRGHQILDYEVHRFKKEDKDNVQMVIAGMVAQRILSRNPDGVFIDVGEGNGVVDRLRELGYSSVVHGVHFGEAPLQDIYLNKRAEMWCQMRDWFHGDDGEVSCPDSDEFQRDLQGMPRDKTTSSGKIQLVSADIIFKTMRMSLDIGSAAGLTFAYPVRSKLEDGTAYVKKRTRPAGQSELITLRKIRKTNTISSNNHRNPFFRGK